MNKLTLAVMAMAVGLQSPPGFTQVDLAYVAVEPCRIVDTRLSSEGVIQANTARTFRVTGSAQELAPQGGKTDCPNVQAGVGKVPLAVAAYIVAVPAESSTRDGILSAYPSNLPPPARGTGATVNFGFNQIAGNTSIVTLCDEQNTSCPGGTLAILARDTDEHVVIDVQGYFYRPSGIPGYQVVQQAFAVANSTAVIVDADCPQGKRALGGGGSLGDSTWVLDSSLPSNEGASWRVRYKSTGATFSASGFAWAVCANVD
ncbi:MAG: hypothetical protein AAGA91_10540 [Pseudomonadota bacterium]